MRPLSLKSILDKALRLFFGRWGIGCIWRVIYWGGMRIVYRRLPPSTFVSPLASVKGWSKIAFGGNNTINRNCVIWVSQLSTGDNVQINPGTCIYGKVEIGDNVMIAPNVMIAGGNHGTSRLDLPMIDQECAAIGVVVESDVWIGANSVIVDGVRIGAGAVVAAGSVVTKSIEPYDIVGGCPALFLKSRIPEGGAERCLAKRC
jgi:acetyltransferase-like isoleucine patch superfamily enzyme